MYKIFLTLIMVATLNAETVGGVALVVKGDAITIYDIEQEMKLSQTDSKNAIDALIRKMLEHQEIKERQITVTSNEVYEDIKKTAAANKLSVSKFYEAVHASNGLTSTQLKLKIREKLLSQKLYSAIAYSSMSEPSEEEIEAYFKANQKSFIHPSGFKVVIYQSKSSERLQEKINNPMFYSPDITSNEQELSYDRISPELSSLLQRTAVNSFTAIIPNGKGEFMSFYLKEIYLAKESTMQGARNKIVNIIMGEQRESVLSEHFTRLRHNADIKTLRDVN